MPRDAFDDVYKLFRKEMGSQLANRLHSKYAPKPAPAPAPTPEAPEFSDDDLGTLESEYSNTPTE